VIQRKGAKQIKGTDSMKSTLRNGQFQMANGKADAQRQMKGRERGESNLIKLNQTKFPSNSSCPLCGSPLRVCDEAALSLNRRPRCGMFAFARAHGLWTYEPRQGRKAATVVCSASAVVTLAFWF
jgi:hypothetical protein